MIGIVLASSLAILSQFDRILLGVPIEDCLVCLIGQLHIALRF